MRILVTGASGFTGGALARRLVREGHAVRALVRSPGQAEALSAAGMEVRVGQLTSARDVLEASRGCDQIHHIAAVFRTAGHPDGHYHDVNVGGTRHVLTAARTHGCERVVHCSTGGVYGHIANPPAAENYPFGPGDVYQRSKLQGEQEVLAAARRGQPVTVFRPGPIYGEGDERFLKLFRAINRRRFVMLGTGRPRLHLTHVDDLVEGILACAVKAEALGEAFLLAGPDAPTLNDLVLLIARTLGVPPPRLRLPVWPVYAAGWFIETCARPLGIDPPLHPRRVAFFTHHREFDCSKAARLLGWRPRITAAAGIARTAAWYRAHGWLGHDH